MEIGVPSSWFSVVSMPSMISCEQHTGSRRQRCRKEGRREEKRVEGREGKREEGREGKREEGREERRKKERREERREEQSSWCNGSNYVAVVSDSILKLTSGGRLDIVGGCVTFALACKVEMELMAGNRGIVARIVGGTSRTATPKTSCRSGHSTTQSQV